jgi:hypothetical protein
MLHSKLTHALRFEAKSCGTLERTAFLSRRWDEQAAPFGDVARPTTSWALRLRRRFHRERPRFRMRAWKRLVAGFAASGDAAMIQSGAALKREHCGPCGASKALFPQISSRLGMDRHRQKIPLALVTPNISTEKLPQLNLIHMGRRWPVRSI